jgi:hypothetical protein
MDHLFELLRHTQLPVGDGTYMDRIGQLGEPEPVAKAALRACGGDIIKALERLVEEVDVLIEAKRSVRRANRSGRPCPPRTGQSATTGRRGSGGEVETASASSS